MKLTHDPHGDVLYIYVQKNGKIAKTLNVTQDVNMDFSAEGQLIGVEVLRASRVLELPYVLSDANDVKELGEPVLASDLP